MSNVVTATFTAGRRAENLASGGRPPYDGSMEDRIEQLEKSVSDMKSDIAVIKSNYATRADLHDGVNGLIKWIVGTAVGLGAAAITVMTFVLNNAAPKSPPVAQSQQPIIIYAQPQAQPASAK